jgi:hypothetical protein
MKNDQVCKAGDSNATEEPILLVNVSDEPHSIYTTPQKRIIILTASVAAFFSPLSANIYLPALNTLAHDLHVSNTLITLTVSKTCGDIHLIGDPC